MSEKVSVEEYEKRLAAWLDALRSGNYKQGKNRLRRDKYFCCLGVACDVYDSSQWWDEIEPSGIMTYLGNASSLPQNLFHYYGFKAHANSTLMTLNDYEGYNFKRIASYIIKHKAELFHWVS